MAQIFRGEEGRRNNNPPSGRLGGAGTSSPTIANVEGEASAATYKQILSSVALSLSSTVIPKVIATDDRDGCVKLPS